jgi:hypothetical protein
MNDCVLNLSLLLRLPVSRRVCLGKSTHLELKTRQSDSWGFADVRRSLSDERTVLLYAIVAGPRQRSHSLLRVPWDSPSYFTVSDSRLSFSSPPTTRRATVEVFDPDSTRDYGRLCNLEVSMENICCLRVS